MDLILEPGAIYKLITTDYYRHCYYVKLPISETIYNQTELFYHSYVETTCRAITIKSRGLALCTFNDIKSIEPVSSVEEEWFNSCMSSNYYRALPPLGKYYVVFEKKHFLLATASKGVPSWEPWVEDIIHLLKSEVPVTLIGEGPSLPTIGFLKGKCIRSL